MGGMTSDTETETSDTTGRGGLSPDDPRTAFAKAVGLTRGVIGDVRSDQLADPTPCPEMDVRSLLGHLVDVLRRVARIGRDENPFALAPAPPVADDGWLDAWQRAAHEVQSAWSDDAVLERTVVLPWSQASGGETLCGYLNEVAVHTWDLAVATGQWPAWDDQVLTVALAAIQQILPAGDRAALFASIASSAQGAAPDEGGFPAPFAEAVEVAPDAPLIDRLVAWNGRTPQRLGQAPGNVR